MKTEIYRATGLFLQLLIAIVALKTLSGVTADTSRPIIGIVAQPTVRARTALGDQYISAGYVKLLESGGARVVPIPYDMDTRDLLALVSQLNGVLFPGGAASTKVHPTYYRTLKTIWDYVIQSNDNSDPMPLMGICLGFEQLIFMATDNADNILSGNFNSDNYTIPLNFTDKARESRFFQHAGKKIMSALATKPITMNNHKYGVSPTTFKSTPALNSFFDALSWNNDRVGNTFLSTMEAKKYPIYGTQWHPEKPLL
eukprot:gene6993-8123_t